MSTNKDTLDEAKSILKNMYHAGVQAVSPKTLILNKVKIEDGKLQVGDESFELKENVYLVGFGKAVMGMSVILEYMLGNRLKKGIVSIPSASANELWESEDKSYFPLLGTSVVDYREGSVNNQPDDRCYETTHQIIDLVESLTENDTLIVLISGGGSALLYMPRPAIDREDKLQLCKKLQNAGADIKEVNVVRRKLSMVKGGGLARMAYPASIITLILSDIVGDPIDLIASGPTTYSNKDPREVLAVLRKYHMMGEIDGDVRRVISAKETFNDGPLLGKGRGKGKGGGKGKKKGKKKGGDKGGGKGGGGSGGKGKGKGKGGKQFVHVDNIIVGNNLVAVQAASTEAWCNRTTPIILRNDITGHVHDVSLAYAHITNLVCLTLDKTMGRQEFFDKVREAPVIPLPPEKVDELYSTIEKISGEGIVLIGAGEPTVVVTGNGKGGRNQELALHFSLDWLAKVKANPRLAEFDVVMLSAGTDGQDGPTDATGAFGYAGIGPLIHDLYAQAKSIASRKMVEVDAKRKAVNERIERYHNRQRQPEICKMQELSGFVTAKKESGPLLTEEEETQEKEPNDDEKLDEEIIRPFILLTMELERMLPENVINDNDSYNLYSRFKKGAELLKTGFTGTNVMDLHFIYIKKRKCDCKIDFTGKEITENRLDMHTLDIDPSTIDKYKTMHVPDTFNWGKYSSRPSDLEKEKDERLNIRIIDDNLLEPCCRKSRKFPATNLLKDQKLPL